MPNSTLSLEVLISCMHQKDHSIIERSNIQTDVIVINQCDENKREEFSFFNKKGEICHVLFISTTERGLSRSRNMAIRNATADICLICDDDECFYDNYYDIISKTYTNYNVDFSAHKLEYNKEYWKKIQRINRLSALKIASWQISFRRKSILNKNIKFDERLGSGVSKAGGEEIQFLYDCIANKLNGFYFPIYIGKHLQSGESQWWRGYSVDYFIDRGIFTKRLMGRCVASLYGAYFLLVKYPQYKDEISVSDAFKSLFTGIIKEN